jgi:flagellar hook-basal body complex protein FliE
MIPAMIAAKAYAAAQNQAAASPAPAAQSQGADFADMVKNAVGEAVSSSRAAEGQMIAHAHGKAELIDVVTSISSAQQSLETVMAVRDQVISAYKEIMAMPI